ncbi:MAG: zinc ribbon domain-containing protein [Tetrasphaera sp.]|nr:zinc ribbon domain-containing protein [Tetrasphaera sp.]
MALRCPQCGRELTDTDRFCITCGSPVKPPGGPQSSDGMTGRPPTAAASRAAAPPSSPPPVTAAPVAPPPSTPPPFTPTPGAFSTPLTSTVAASAVSGAPEIGLLPGERQLYEVTFAPKLLAPHLLTYLTVTDKRIIVRHPNTLFGFFPLGYLVSSAPHSSVEQVDSGMHMSSRHLVAGALALMSALFSLAWGASSSEGMLFFVVALVAGLALLLTAKKVGVLIHTGGAHLVALARGSQQADALAAAQIVNRLVLETEESRGGRI